MPKFFVISDIHGFYDHMINALNEAGFDSENEEHWLISCGDVFDRGNQPLQVMEYLSNLPRKILIRGNHEDLFVDMCRRGYALSHDFYNGTAQTVLELGTKHDIGNACYLALQKANGFIDSMVNYFETKNHIFVHSFIPLRCNDDLPTHYTKNRKFEANPDWRNASDEEWLNARWGNPYDLAEQGFLPAKTLVFGHWHCSTGWAKTNGISEMGEDAKFDPFYGEGFISIDACTAHSKKCNVIVIQDDFIKI